VNIYIAHYHFKEISSALVTSFLMVSTPMTLNELKPQNRGF